VRGDVVIDVRTDEPNRRFALGTSFQHAGGVLVVDDVRWHSGRLLVRFAGVSDRGGAERLKGIELSLEVGADDRPDDPDEYYDHQIRGLVAETTDGSLIGTVVDVLHLPGQDVLAISAVDGGPGEILVPFVSEMVVEVDLVAGRVRVDDPAGLLDEAGELGHGVAPTESTGPAGP
jgi:16S rRNA processing protein RimM